MVEWKGSAHHYRWAPAEMAWWQKSAGQNRRRAKVIGSIYEPHFWQPDGWAAKRAWCHFGKTGGWAAFPSFTSGPDTRPWRRRLTLPASCRPWGTKLGGARDVTGDEPEIGWRDVRQHGRSAVRRSRRARVARARRTARRGAGVPHGERHARSRHRRDRLGASGTRRSLRRHLRRDAGAHPAPRGDRRHRAGARGAGGPHCHDRRRLHHRRRQSGAALPRQRHRLGGGTGCVASDTAARW